MCNSKIKKGLDDSYMRVVGRVMVQRPRVIYELILLWLSLSTIFVVWGIYSLILVLQLPTWGSEEPVVSPLVPVLHFGYFLSTVVWFVFSALFIIFAYATFRKEGWAWTTGIIISTIFIVVFGLMLMAFMVNAVIFFDWFSVNGLVTVILSFFADLGIIFLLTRPVAKQYFEVV